MLSDQGFIYVIGADESPLVKIGWAKSPKARLANLQCGSPVTLKLLNYFPGDRKMETWLHRNFSQQRRHGEWFRLAKRVSLIEQAAERYRSGDNSYDGPQPERLT